MPQVSLYLEQEILDAARHNASLEKISFSKYVSRALAKAAASEWPQGYWDLFGALNDDSFVRPNDMPFTEVSEKVAFS